MKIRHCTECGLAMEVPKQSGRKYCPECWKTRARQKAKNWYDSIVGSEKLQAYRDKASSAQKERLKDAGYRMVTRAKERARAKNVECTITPDCLSIPDKCPVLGTEFIPNTEYAMSIDAIDPTRGYVPDNVQVISMKANAMKNSASKEELEKFAKWVLKI